MTVPVRPVYVAEIDGPDPTYIASFTGLNVGTSATTDIMSMSGSSTMLIRIVQVNLSGLALTAGAHFDVIALIRSTLNTGGTSSAMNVGKQDSNDPATSATNLLTYTAAPATGTLLGYQGSQKLFAPVAGSALNVGVQFNFGYGAGAKALLLRNVNQSFCLNLGGVTPANGTSFDGFLVYTERVFAGNNY